MTYRIAGRGWLPDPPDHRDWKLRHGNVRRRLRHVLPITSLSARTSRKAPSSAAFPTVGDLKADLRHWCSPIEDQGRIGSCTAQATVGALEYFERKTRGQHVDASRLFLYRATRKFLGWEGQGDTGAFVRSAIKSLRLFGTCPERYWPYDESAWDAEPAAFHYAYAQNFKAVEYFKLSLDTDELKSCLDSGLPFIFGFTCFSSLDDPETADTGIIPYPKPQDSMTGGHAVLAVGYTDSHVLIRNSWSTGWGDDGYGYLPWTYFDAYHALAGDCWVLLNADWVPDDEADADAVALVSMALSKKKPPKRFVSPATLTRTHQTQSWERAAPTAPAIKVRAGFDPCRRVPMRLGAKRVETAEAPVPGLVASESSVSLYLKELTLNDSFDFALFGEATNELYVVGVCWDLSGKPPVVFPPQQATKVPASDYRMEKGDTIRFVGDGIQLWPSQKVVGGLYVRLVVMENDDDVREIGKQIEKVRSSVENSGLATILASLATAANAGTLAAVASAANVVVKNIASVLQDNGDDLVDVFDGAYGAERITSSRTERYAQRGCMITLDFGVT